MWYVHRVSQYEIHQNKDWNRYFYRDYDRIPRRSQYEIHQNKDWNYLKGGGPALWVRSQYEIHQNKDWNSLIVSIKFPNTLSQYEIHQNKDWNSILFEASENVGYGHNMRSTKTRIETELNEQHGWKGKCHNMRSTKTRIETHNVANLPISCVFVTIWDPPKQGLKLGFRSPTKEGPGRSQYEIHQNKDWNP